jgi:hypothetical protein
MTNMTSHRTRCDHVHIVSHICRRATHIASLEAAKGKDDKEFITVMNPAVSSNPPATKYDI